jgi:hypothetical protein
VIEHIDNPLAFLDKSYSVLNDNGVMSIALPIQDRLNYDIFFADHIHHFSHSNFIKILYNSGFEVVNYQLGKESYFNIAMYSCKKIMKPLVYKKYTFIENNNIKNIQIIQNNIKKIIENTHKNLYAFGYGEIAKTIVPYTHLDQYILSYIDDYTYEKDILTSQKSKAVFKDFKYVTLIILVNPYYYQAILELYKDFKQIRFVNIFEGMVL